MDLEQLFNTQFLASGFTLVVLGYLLPYVRLLWNFIYNYLILRTFFTSVTIWNDNPDNFRMFEAWLSNQKYVKEKCNHCKLEDKNRYSSSHSENAIGHSILVPGYGTHWFFFNKRLMYLYATEDSSQTNVSDKGKRQGYHIRWFPRNRNLIKEIIEAGKVLLEDNSEKSPDIYTADGSYWEHNGSLNERKEHTIFTNDNKFQLLYEDIQNFLNSKEQYSNLGKPYHRSYLLYGPPGTGKSSIINAIASKLKYNIALLNFNSTSSYSIDPLWSRIPDNTIVVLEEIDCLTSAVERKETSPGKISTNQLLNLLDGINYKSGLIVIATTNFRDKLDPALLRPGRLDKHIFLDKPNTETIKNIVEYYCPNENIDSSKFEGKTQAEIIEQLLNPELEEILA